PRLIEIHKPTISSRCPATMIPSAIPDECVPRRSAQKISPTVHAHNDTDIAIIAIRLMTSSGTPWRTTSLSASSNRPSAPKNRFSAMASAAAAAYSVSNCCSSGALVGRARPSSSRACASARDAVRFGGRAAHRVRTSGSAATEQTADQPAGAERDRQRLHRPLAHEIAHRIESVFGAFARILGQFAAAFACVLQRFASALAHFRRFLGGAHRGARAGVGGVLNALVDAIGCGVEFLLGSLHRFVGALLEALRTGFDARTGLRCAAIVRRAARNRGGGCGFVDHDLPLLVC